MEFTRDKFDPDFALECDKNEQFPTALWKKACGLGFVGGHFPEAYGGAGFGLIENTLIIEAFCRQDSGIGMALALSDFGSDVEIATEVKLGRNFLDKLIADHMEGKGIVVEVSMAKYWTTEMAMRVADRCMELYGNDGTCKTDPIARPGAMQVSCPSLQGPMRL